MTGWIFFAFVSTAIADESTLQLAITNDRVSVAVQHGSCPALVDRRSYVIPLDSQEQRDDFANLSAQLDGDPTRSDGLWMDVLNTRRKPVDAVGVALLYAEWSRHRASKKFTVPLLESLLEEDVYRDIDSEYRLLIMLEIARQQWQYDIPGIKKQIRESKDYLHLIEGELGADVAADYWTEIGDWEVWMEESRRARKSYANAWNAYELAGAQPDSVFDKPYFLCACWMLNADAVDDYEKNDPPIDVKVTATINRNGEVKRPRILEADLGRKEGRAMLTVEHTHFRPAMREGETVSTPSVHFVRRVYAGGQGHHRGLQFSRVEGHVSTPPATQAIK